ncbi:MAG: hypothetical protein IJ406_05570 [Oscillospiraceae bacterium]|nr:hypothetical protein [Oscillospiraceae bacterium]
MEFIKKYLIEEKKMSNVVAERMINKLERHPDICGEFEKWIANRVYETNNPVSAEGYTGADIVKIAPFMDGLGVFTFLVSLREQPDLAKKQIEAGFPRK